MFVERSWRHALKRSISTPHATLYAARARQLAAAEIPTPHPVATVVERCCGLVGNFRVVYRYTPGVLLGSFSQSITADDRMSPAERSEIIDEIGNQLIVLGDRLAEIGIAPTDVYLGNFLVDDHHSIQMLDLDALRTTCSRGRLPRSRHQFQMLRI